jgi:hypothetical protein
MVYTVGVDQFTIVAIVVALSAFVVGRSVVSSFTKSGCASGCGKCPAVPAEVPVAGRISLM